VSYGKSRYVEKSKKRTFPLRLEIPPSGGVSHFSHSSGGGSVGQQKNKIADLERFDYSAVV